MKKQYIDKTVVKAEIIKRLKYNGTRVELDGSAYFAGKEKEDEDILSFLNTLEVKEVDLNNGIQLTWEDIRELYIIFAEVDVEIELCKSDNIKSETIGYYQEVLKRFKTRKGE